MCSYLKCTLRNFADSEYFQTAPGDVVHVHFADYNDGTTCKVALNQLKV